MSYRQAWDGPSGTADIMCASQTGNDADQSSSGIVYMFNFSKSGYGAGPYVGNATKGMKNRGAQKVVQQLLNLGLPTQTALRVARVASPLGLLALGGEGLYKMYKEGHFEKERMMPSLMDKEVYAGAQKEKFDVSKPMFKKGGKVDDDK